MARQSKGSRLQLGEPVQTMLADFCKAQHDAAERTVVRAAVKAYIEHQLSHEAETNRRYLEIKTQREGAKTGA